MEQIAQQRQLTPGTILGHLAAAAEAGEAMDLRVFVTAEEQEEIEAALRQYPGVALSPAHQALQGRFDFGVLRLVRAVRAAAEPS